MTILDNNSTLLLKDGTRRVHLTTADEAARSCPFYVTIDISTGSRAAIRTGLPHAQIVVHHCHVVQFANKMLNIVCRTTATLRSWRGRAADPG